MPAYIDLTNIMNAIFRYKLRPASTCPPKEGLTWAHVKMKS